MTLSNRCQSRLCDYFVVCGLDFTSGLEPDYLSGDVLCPPLKRSYKGKVLEHYPNSVPGNSFDHDSVCMICLVVAPSCLKEERLQKCTHLSIIMPLSYYNVSSSEITCVAGCKLELKFPYNTFTQFIFTLKIKLSLPKGLQFATQKQIIEPAFHSYLVTREDGSRYYGFSYIFYEEVKNKKVCNAVHTLQAMYLTELSSTSSKENVYCNSSKSLPKHFKISSQLPGFYYDCNKDTLFVTKSVAIIMQLPYVTAACKFLSALHKYAFTKPEVPHQLSVESYIYNFLYEVPLPQPGRSVEFQIVNTQEYLILQRPISIEELPLLDYSLCTLFTLLSVDVILQLFTCILLEHQVLICASDFQTLMLIAECLTNLLFPFSWQHVYVPILPNSLHHFLDAPVPFIMGIHSQETQLKPTVSGDLCYVNVDNNDIEVPEELPTFPKFCEFRTEICDLLKKHGIITGFTTSQKSCNIMSSSVLIPGTEGRYLDQKAGKYPGTSEAEDYDGNFLEKVELTRKNGVEVDDVKDTMGLNGWTYEEELKFNNAIRETFLSRFVNIFHSYEHFVILPNEKEKSEWFKERESMQNFDKATFLSDQPTQHLPFLSQFLETQMFASFIDSKILATFNEIDTNLRVFDKRIKNARKRNNRDPSGKKDKFESCEAAVRASRLLLEKRLSAVDYKVPPPKEVLRAPSEHFKLLKTPVLFPPLDASALNQEPARRQCNSYIQWPPPRKQSDPGDNNAVGTLTHVTYHNKLNKNLDQSPARLAQANWNFVEKLLKDCKLKTNRMVLEKMGAEGLILGKEQVGNIEENTLIASLCDLLERVWSHAVQQKQGKSALWNHLLKFKELEEGSSKTADSATADFSERQFYGNNSPAMTPDSRSLDRRYTDGTMERAILKRLPVSVTFDIRNVQAMSEIKSQIGYARAWIRLALEKKLLSRHLQKLLSVKNLLKSQYKRNAFLRCEEEREQFLYHLLSLNAVDYYCFTNTYLSTKLPYRIIVFPSKKSHVSSTTANAWVAISGTNCETSQLPIPKGMLDFIVNHKNLGILTSLRIGHDNDGSSPNWMVEKVLVRCEVTGHTFRFPCGRYLGKGVDDGSSERLLIAELVKPENENINNTTNDSLTPIQCRSPLISRRENKLNLSEIQHMIGDSVNSVVKYFHRFTATRQRENRAKLTPLLCGEMGLVHSLEQAFLYGFKMRSFFGRNLYLWDYFLRVKEQFDVLLFESRMNKHFNRGGGSLDRRLQNINIGKENVVGDNETLKTDQQSMREKLKDHIPRSSGLQPFIFNKNPQKQSFTLPRNRDDSPQGKGSEESNSHVMQKYCEIVSKIENCHRAFGKDGKFQRFICFAVRDHILHRMLTPLASSRPTLEMYDANSFLRNVELRSFLYDILKSLDEYNFYLESSITSGIEIN